MRLLVLNDCGIQGGGTENRIRLLLDELLRSKTVTSVDILQSADRPAYSLSRAFSVSSTGGGFRRTYRQAGDIIRRKRIDLIQAHNMQGMTPCGIEAARRAGIPVVWFAHDYWPLCSRRSFVDASRARFRSTCGAARTAACMRCAGLRTLARMQLYRFCMRGVDLAVATCDFVRAFYERHGFLRGRWQVVPPWISTDIFSAVSEDSARERTVVFTGSLLDYKGAWVLAQAAPLIRERFPDVRFLFIGAEEEKIGPVAAVFAQAGLSGAVTFKGYTRWEDMVRIYRRAGVYVCPTVCMETFGLNWAEAMACGVPVVASAIGSLPEFLKGRAVLFPARDHLRCAGAIIRVLEDRTLAGELSVKGAGYVRSHFQVKKAADTLGAGYRQLLAGGAR